MRAIMGATRFANVTLGIDCRRPGEEIRRHRHGSGYAALVLSGSYSEAGEDGHLEIGAGNVVFHGSFHAHSNCIGDRGALIFNLSLPWWFEPSNPVGHASNLDEIAIRAETSTRDALSLLFASVVPIMPRPSDWPDELAQALHSNPGLSIFDWARSKGLSPWQISRDFSRIFGVPAASYRAQVRARKAWRWLISGEKPLANLAMEAGFADQAHMNRAIKKLTGQTPGYWRTQVCSRLSCSLSPD